MRDDEEERDERGVNLKMPLIVEAPTDQPEIEQRQPEQRNDSGQVGEHRDDVRPDRASRPASRAESPQ